MSLRYCDDTFFDTFISTIGIDFKIKTIEILQNIVKLQIWDSTPQRKQTPILKAYYRGAHAIIIAFDLNAAEGFQNCENWMNDIIRYAQEGVCVALCGTKCDLEQKVDQEEIDKFCQEHSLPYFKTSSKEDIGINEIFQYVSEQAFPKFSGSPFGVAPPSMTFNLQPVLNIDEFMKHFVPQKKDSTCVIQ